MDPVNAQASDGRGEGVLFQAAFDDHRPPSLAITKDCVHCGFCLPACPTYVLGAQEMDSPRGRIDLIRQGLDGEPMSPALVQHVDACLGCLACVSACPSGVRYDQLVEAARAQIERRGGQFRTRRQRWLRRALFAVFPYPRRLRLLRGPLWLHQRTGLSWLLRRTGVLDRTSPTLATMEAVAPRVGRRTPVAERTPALPPRRRVVGLLLGCVQREFYPHVNAATVEVLAAEGCEVVALRRQGCCGALSLHNGRAEEARAFARALVEVFSGVDVDCIVVNAAGCGSTMKQYGELLADEPSYSAAAAALADKVVDIAELLDSMPSRAVRHPLAMTVAYHDACHLAHAQGIRSEPRKLLSAVPGLEVKEVGEGSLCCGSAGVYNLLAPLEAAELGERKARNIAATGAGLVVAANPGCLLQITSALRRLGADVPTAHTIEVIAASIRGEGADSFLRRSRT